jgi:acetyl esterase/lipase
MIQRIFTGLAAILTLSIVAIAQAVPETNLELTSLLWRKLYALPDDDAVHTAQAQLTADPKNTALVLALSKAQAARRQYREAVATCTLGLAFAPQNADLYLERGHRELGLRDFKAAQIDLSKAAELDPQLLDAHYHLGLALYFQRQFDKAAESFGRALDLAKTPDSIIDCSNWRYVSLRRAAQTGAAARVLTRITPEIKNTEPHLYFYLQLLHFYQGKRSEDQILPDKPASPTDIEGELSFNTINYGVGNWHLYNGDQAHASEYFKRVVSGYAWNSWGFIGSELELAGEIGGQAALPPPPAPLGVPQPGPATDAPYAPQPILPGGVVIPLYPPDSPLLNASRIREPEQYSISKSVPGRINSIINIHNPSIEVHTVDHGLNTGVAVILVAGGGHNTLNVGSEAADFVPFFYNYGVNTVILRNRLRHDGYNPQTDAVNDALQAIRLVRAHAKDWDLDPHKIGMMGFSAGAELTAAAAVLYDEFDRKNHDSGDALAGVTSRPDFAGIIYPGPSPFAHSRTPPPIPRDVPPAFIACGGSGDRVHAVWAIEYFSAMLNLGVPNIEMHIYGNGRHPGDPLPDGSHMTGGLTDRKDTPFGTWQFRFIDWFRNLGFLQPPGVETKAAKDSAAFADQPSR